MLNQQAVFQGGMAASDLRATSAAPTVPEQAANIAINICKRLEEIAIRLNVQSSAMFYQEPKPGKEQQNVPQQAPTCLESILNIFEQDAHRLLLQIEQTVAYNDAKLGLR